MKISRLNTEYGMLGYIIKYNGASNIPYIFRDRNRKEDDDPLG